MTNQGEPGPAKPSGFFVRSVDSVVGAASLLMGASSVVSLIQHAFSVGFISAIQIMLDFYERLICMLIGWWAEPIIRDLLARLNALVDWDLHLYPHWKHIFVLVAVYFFRDAAASGPIKRPGGEIFLSAIGLPIAAAISIGAGCIAASPNNWRANFAIAAVAVIGVTLFDIAKLIWYAGWLRPWVAKRRGRTLEKYWPYLTGRLHFPARTFLVGMLIAASAPAIPLVRDLPNSGLAVVLVLVLILTVYWLGVGVTRVDEVRQPGDTWWGAFRRSGPGLLGLAMLSVFIGAFVVVACNSMALEVGVR